MPEILKPDVIQPGLFENLIMQPANRLGQVGLLGRRMHEYQRTARVSGMLFSQELHQFQRQTDGSGSAFVLHQLPLFH